MHNSTAVRSTTQGEDLRRVGRLARVAALVAAGAMAVAACSSGASTTASGDDDATEAGPVAAEVTDATDAGVTAGSGDDAAGSDEPAIIADASEDVPATAAAAGDEDDPAAATEPAGDDAGDEPAAAAPLGGPLAEDPQAALIAALTPVGPGDSGPGVEALQQRLGTLGFAPGRPDGDYGGRTVASVEAFQELVGLTVTGLADAATIDALVTYRYDGPLLHAGEQGPLVEELQERLLSGPFDPGTVDGEYGARTVQAVWALEKLAGIPIDGNWGPLDERAWELLEAGTIGAPTNDHDERWVEVDLSEQLVKIYDPGSTVPTLVSHVSSGSGIPWENEEHSGSSITPLGDFHIERRIAGWRESSLDIGRLYNPLYFTGGIAFHGALSVPLYPASHGCVRVPMHIAEYLPDELPNGTPVHVQA